MMFLLPIPVTVGLLYLKAWRKNCAVNLKKDKLMSNENESEWVEL
jgi:hypothetical protein